MLVVEPGLEAAELAALEVVEPELAVAPEQPVVAANLEEPVDGQAVANLAVVLVPVGVAAMLAAVGYFVVNHPESTGHLEALAVVGLALGNHLVLGRLASYPH